MLKAACKALKRAEDALDAEIGAAVQAGVTRILTVGMDGDSCRSALAAAYDRHFLDPRIRVNQSLAGITHEIESPDSCHAREAHPRALMNILAL